MSKILLVEDDNNLREIYEARLQAEGFTISSASNGEDALVLVKKELPDLIISDVMMPKISGFEMLDIIKNTPGLENIKVIMLTALGQNDDQDRAGKLGADRYLVKSQVTLENIVNVAQELLGNNSTNMNEQINNSAMPNPNDLSKPIEPAYNTINVDPSPIDNQLPIDTNSTVSPVDNLTTPAPQPAVIDNSTVSPNDNLATPAPQPAVIDNSVTLDNNIPTAINNNDPTTIPIDNNNVMVATDQNIAPSTTDQNNQQVIDQAVNTLNDQMSNNDNLDSSSLPFSPPSLSPPSGSQRTINPINNSTPIFSNTTNPIDAPDSNLSTAPQPNFDNSSINNDLNNIAL